MPERLLWMWINGYSGNICRCLDLRLTELSFVMLPAVTSKNLERFLKAIGREPSYIDFEV